MAAETVGADLPFAGRIAVDIPPDAAGRHVLCADVTLGERRFGWLPEAIVDIL